MRDGAIPLLAGSVPDLGLDLGALEGEGLGGELDADGGLGLVDELVLLEAGEEVGLADAGVCVGEGVPPITTILNRWSKFSPTMLIQYDN